MNRKSLRGMKAALLTGGVAGIVSAATLPAAAAVAGPSHDPAGGDTSPGVASAARAGVSEQQVSRVKSRSAARQVRHQRRHLAQMRRTRLLSGPPETVARYLVRQRGWSSLQWSCLDALWARESHWNVHSENATSGAYGIPQALPGDKMSTRGADWRESAVTQIQWGLDYIAAKYGSPCVADEHSLSYGYY